LDAPPSHAGESSFDDIRSAVEKAVASGDVERLILFFAGHGSESSPLGESWLLSDYDRRADEVVNVAGKIPGASAATTL